MVKIFDAQAFFDMENGRNSLRLSLNYYKDNKYYDELWRNYKQCKSSFAVFARRFRETGYRGWIISLHNNGDGVASISDRKDYELYVDNNYLRDLPPMPPKANNERETIMAMKSALEVL